VGNACSTERPGKPSGCPRAGSATR
jgi:hypothetical protein